MIGVGAQPLLRGLQHDVAGRCRPAVDRIDQHQLFFHPNGACRHPHSLPRPCFRFGQRACWKQYTAPTTAGDTMTTTNELGAGPGGEFVRDSRYITTRITRDGRDGYPVEPGRYRLVVARACPWANRATIVRRLLGLEDVLSLGVCGPTHDERSWTFDLDPGGVDPVLGIERLQQAYFARDPDYPLGITVPAIVDVPTGQVVTNDYAQMTLDLSTAVVGVPPRRVRRTCTRRRCGRRSTRSTTSSSGTSTTASTGAVSPAPRRATTRPTTGCSPGWTGCRERLTDQRYLVGDTITEADVRLFTTLARFDAVYHGHFKCNRNKLTEMPVLWAYARDLFQTPGFGDTIDFDADQEALLRGAHQHQPDADRAEGTGPGQLVRPARPRRARRPPVRRRHAAGVTAAGRDAHRLLDGWHGACNLSAFPAAERSIPAR